MSLVVAPGQLLLFGAGTGGSLLWSSTDSVHWNRVTLPNAMSALAVSGATWRRGRFVAILANKFIGGPVTAYGESDTVWTSTDGINWQRCSIGPDGIAGQHRLYDDRLSHWRQSTRNEPSDHLVFARRRSLEQSFCRESAWGRYRRRRRQHMGGDRYEGFAKPSQRLRLWINHYILLVVPFGNDLDKGLRAAAWPVGPQR